MCSAHNDWNFPSQMHRMVIFKSYACSCVPVSMFVIDSRSADSPLVPTRHSRCPHLCMSYLFLV
jgi:hypothetical protein